MRFQDGGPVDPSEYMPGVHPVHGLAEIIWDASRADEGTISATGARKIARAILDSDWFRTRLTEAQKDSPVNYKVFADAIEEMREMVQATVAALVSDGFTDREARVIIAGMWAHHGGVDDGS